MILAGRTVCFQLISLSVWTFRDVFVSAKLFGFQSSQQHHNNNGNCSGTTVTRISTACGAYQGTLWQSNPKQLMYQPPQSHIHHTHAHTYTSTQTRASFLGYREIKTTLEQKMKKKNTALMTASCHSPSHLIGAMETDKSSLLLYFYSFYFSLNFIPFLFPSFFCILRGGWGKSIHVPGSE